MSIEVGNANIAHCTIPDDVEHSRYRFVIVAGRRARQLQAGARPALPTSARKATVIAMEEVSRGLVKYRLTGPMVDGILSDLPGEDILL